MNWYGILIGFAGFALIGVFHPIVIKAEYYFGARIWPLFLVSGLAALIGSLLISNPILSCITAFAGFCMFWSIHELKEQEQRVRKGWFPANPRRTSRSRIFSKTQKCPGEPDGIGDKRQ